MTKKKFLLTVVLPVCLSIIAGLLIIILNYNNVLGTRARAVVSNEKAQLNEEISQLSAEKDSLTAQISSYDETLSANASEVQEIDTLSNELQTYTTDIENMKSRITEIDSQISEKSIYLSGLDTLPKESEGEKITLSKGEYKCPADIKAGRYRAEGSGIIYIYSIANSLTAKEDLSTIDTHSYTFDIKSGESIKIDDSVTLTEVTNDKATAQPTVQSTAKPTENSNND